jgi:hypothetical protein
VDEVVDEHERGGPGALVMRCPLTASTLRCASSAISRLVAGVASAELASGRQSATSRCRWVSVTGIAPCPRPATSVDTPLARRRTEEHRRLADAQAVAVAQPPAPGHPFAVHVGAVARQPVVDQRPVAADRFEGLGPEHVVPVGAAGRTSAGREARRPSVAHTGRIPTLMRHAWRLSLAERGFLATVELPGIPRRPCENLDALAGTLQDRPALVPV